MIVIGFLGLLVAVVLLISLTDPPGAESGLR
jgi:hypothetical protein